MVRKIQIDGSSSEYDATSLYANFHKNSFVMPTLNEIGFEESLIKVKPHNLKFISNYQDTRDFQRWIKPRIYPPSKVWNS
jgi:deoxyribodipyrimidine photo-lyase